MTEDECPKAVCTCLTEAPPAMSADEEVPQAVRGQVDGADRPGVKRPGLLLEWRQGRSGWEGRVVYAVQLRADGWASVEEWVPAGLLGEP